MENEIKEGWLGSEMIQYVIWLRSKGVEYDNLTPEQDERYFNKWIKACERKELKRIFE